MANESYDASMQFGCKAPKNVVDYLAEKETAADHEQQQLSEAAARIAAAKDQAAKQSSADDFDALLDGFDSGDEAAEAMPARPKILPGTYSSSFATPSKPAPKAKCQSNSGSKQKAASQASANLSTTASGSVRSVEETTDSAGGKQELDPEMQRVAEKHLSTENCLGSGPFVLSYERRARGEVAYEGQWWAVRFPKPVWIQSWERLLQDSKEDGRPCEDHPFVPPDLPRPLAVLQGWRQHSCLVPVAQRFAKTRCLVFIALVNSLHLGEHWQDHLHFFRNFRFVEEVETQAVHWIQDAKNRRAAHVQDTKPTHGGPSSAHVAIDVTICARASHFLGTATSSLSALIGSLRYAANRTGETASYFPRLPRVDLEEYELGLFPLSSSLPSEGELQHFFHGLETKVSAASSRSFFDCSVDARREGQRGSPRYGSGMAIVNTVLPFGEERTSAVLVTRDLIEYAWQESAWSCPPVALIAYMQLLVGLQNASRWGPAAGFDPTSPHELYLETSCGFVR
eukprot:g30739.t1